MLTRVAIKYDDLLGLLWRRGGRGAQDGGIDCANVAAEVIRRCGLRLRPGALPLTEEDLRVAVASLEEDPATALWGRLGGSVDDARELGDVVLALYRAQGEPEPVAHVLTLVDVRSRLFLTAYEEFGVRAVSWRFVRGVVGVYRAKPGTPRRSIGTSDVPAEEEPCSGP